MKIGWIVKAKNCPETDWTVYEMDDTHVHVMNLAYQSRKPHNKVLLRNFLLDEIEIVREDWPARGPTFNQWNKEFKEFSFLVSFIDGDMWYRHSQFKYVTIVADLRANCFRLTDRDSKDVDPIFLLNSMRSD